MTNQAARPSYPERGNRSTRALYEAIGRALTTWEEFEIRLAELYAALSEKSKFDETACRRYGAKLNFKERLTEVERAGRRYFVKRPHQEREGELASIIKSGRSCAERRNDVAHGTVQDFHTTRNPDRSALSTTGLPEWCLVPQRFRADAFTSGDTPKYVLTSRELNQTSKQLWPLINRAYLLADAVELPIHASRRKSVRPPFPPLPARSLW